MLARPTQLLWLLASASFIVHLACASGTIIRFGRTNDSSTVAQQPLTGRSPRQDGPFFAGVGDDAGAGIPSRGRPTTVMVLDRNITDELPLLTCQLAPEAPSSAPVSLNEGGYPVRSRRKTAGTHNVGRPKPCALGPIHV